MTLFTRLATTALAGFCALGMVGAAQAHHTQQQPYVVSETRSLLQAATSLGVQVFTDKEAPEACKDGLLGMANGSHQLLLCVDNHANDMDELADTIRHELVHIAQFCKGRKVGATSALLYPELRDKALAGARDHLHMPMDRYEPRKHAAEAEARVLAQIYEERQIAALLKRHCS